MILLASGTALIERFGCQPWLGQLVCPRSRNRIVLPRWAADNAAFSKFNAAAYIAMLERIATASTRPIFVTVPDVVGDAAATLQLWWKWMRILRPLKLPLAFVLQDGVDLVGAPLGDRACAAVFIGGTTSFKVGPVARAFVEKAKAKGLWVHMGRVNTVRRLMYAQQIGCDSVDGSGFARFPNEMIPRFTRVNDNRILTERAP